MISNLWPIAVRTTALVDVEHCVKAQIQERFLQSPELFRSDMAQLASARTEATQSTTSEATHAARLALYYWHLKTVARKFHDDLWEATWTDATHGSTTRLSLAFERCNVLYNLAAVHSGVGLAEDRRTLDGLKQSHAALQQSAGLFALLAKDIEAASTEVIMPHDLTEDVAQALQHLTLAEAQECIWQRAVMDRMKDKLIAQLSQQVSDHYGAALDYHRQSQALDSKLIHHLSLKRAHFAAAAQFRMSSHAIAQQLYGEEVARLRLAHELCTQAASHADYVAAPITSDFKSLVDRVNVSLVRAERDNDIIYMLPVPPASQLAAIVPTSMVKPVLSDALKASLDDTSGGLFQALVSSVVSNVLAIYNQRKDQLVQMRAIKPMTQLTVDMTAFLQERQLPGVLTAIEQPLGLPSSVLRSAEDVKSKGGLDHLKLLLAEGVSLVEANVGLLDQVTELMDEEEEEDATLRAQLGTRNYTLPPSAEALADYRKQLNQYRDFLTQAQQADQLVAHKVQDWTPALTLLSGPTEALSASVPNAQQVALPPAAERCAHQVRQLLARWDRMQSRREEQVKQVRQFAAADEPKERLLQEAERAPDRSNVDAGEFEPLMEELLQRYEALLLPLQDEAEAQKALEKEIDKAYTAFASHKSTSAGGTELRQAALQQLSQAASKFDEIRTNLSEGAKFYHDLHGALNRLSDEIRDRLAVRRQAMAEADASVVGALEEMRLQEEAEATKTEPARDVLMTGVWKPEDGIKLMSSGATKTPAAKPSIKKPSGSLFNPAIHNIQFEKR